MNTRPNSRPLSPRRFDTNTLPRTDTTASRDSPVPLHEVIGDAQTFEGFAEPRYLLVARAEHHEDVVGLDAAVQQPLHPIRCPPALLP